MKKLICLISTATMLAGFSVQAATLNEWNFYSDPAGKTLSNAYNSAGSAAFILNPGYSDSALFTDGAGNLVSTNADVGDTGMWTNGAMLSASLGTNITSGTQYFRYDFSYDLSDTNSLNDSGCVVGFAFYDGISNKLAGVALEYDVGATTNVPYQVTELTNMTDTAGTIAVIAKVNLDNHTLDVWYNLTGNVGGFSSNSPMSTVSNLTLSSFNSLGFQATGDIRVSNSTDQVSINLLRTADTWTDIMTTVPMAPAAKYANEWTFERDIDGRSLSEAINSGTNNPLAQFSAGYGSTVFTTNRTLLCTGDDTNTDSGSVWTNGAILDAALTSSTSGVHYLRYDVNYSLTNSLNNSGTILGVYFADGVSDSNKAAGLVLGYDTGNLTNAIPANRTLTAVTNGLALSGSLTAIAEVDLNSSPATLKVWYGLNGFNPTNYAAPAFTTNLTLTSIDNLRFHATGDFRPAGSDDYAAMDNIRQIDSPVADTNSWNEIITLPANLTAAPVLTVSSVTDSQNGTMNVGETNTVTVIISNSGGPASGVSSILTQSGPSSAFTIISNNASVALGAGSTTTNTYELIANERGNYTITVTAVSDTTNSAPVSFPLAAGANLSFLPPDITEISGGNFAGLYEPGETLNIIITSTNDGAKVVSNVVNTLSANPAVFSITPSTANYPAIALGAGTTTTYQVVISPSALAGDYSFSVTNQAGSLMWSTNFNLTVFIRQPYSEWVKKNNTNALNQGSSWVDSQVPNSTDRAIFTTNITVALTNNLGSDLSWRGVALISNTAPWIITGSNTLTTGSAGIDMSQAQANLTIASKLSLATTQTWNVATSQTLTVSGPVSGTNTASLIKSGTGSLVLNGTNTYTGGTVLSNGTLSIGNNKALGKGDVTAHGATVTATASATLANNFTLNDSVLFNNPNDLTLSGTISGGGSLTKTGSGILALYGTNTYSGGTTNSGIIEVNNISSLGSGTLTLNNGSTLQAIPSVFFTGGAGIPNAIELAGNATIQTKTTTSPDIIRVDGNISGPGALTLSGQQIVLYANNTFSGGLVLQHANWLRFNGPQSLGTGNIAINSGTRLLLALANGNITNNISMGGNLRLHSNGKSLEFSGLISGTGNFDFQDNVAGSLTFSGNNSSWSGGFINARGTRTIIVNNTNALGSGAFTLGNGPGNITFVFNQDISLGNSMQIGSFYNSDSGADYPLTFTANKNVNLSGVLKDWSSSVEAKGILKNGLSNLTLSAANTYSGPTEVAEGMLTVNGSLASPLLTIDSGATLSGTGSVQNVVATDGSTLQISQGTMTFGGDLNIAANATTILGISSSNTYASLTGNGINEIILGGTLKLDFTGNTTVSAGNTFHLLNNWGILTDSGVTVTKTGLSGALALDTSNLFVDGTVSIVAQNITAPPRQPGDIVKAENNDNLNLATSWTNGVVPVSTNRAVYDSTLITPHVTSMGASASWKGIALISNEVSWTINGSNTLTLGSSGIDMSEARADLTFSAPLSVTTTQIWNVAALRTLTMSGRVSENSQAALIKTGEGTLTLSGTNTYSGGTIVSNGTLSVGADNAVGTGVLTLNHAKIGAIAPVTLTNDAVLSGSALFNNNNSLTLNGTISGLGNLTKTGSSILFLGGTNTYSGGTTNSGTIQIGNPNSLGSGAVVMTEGSILYAYPPAFPSGSTMYNDVELTGAAVFTNIFGSAGLMSFDGNITGSGSLKISGYQFYLRGNNTFSGGLNLDNSNWLWFENGALGTGPITAMRSTLLRQMDSSVISNSIIMNNTFRLNSVNLPMTVSGSMSGSGQFQVIDTTSGTIELTGDNSARTGTTLMRGGGLRLGNSTALGTGEIQFQPQYLNFSFQVSSDLTGTNRLANDLNITGSYIDTSTSLLIPIVFDLDHNLELSGKFYSSITDLIPIEKNGSGTLILSGSNEYLDPIHVNAGSLIANNTILSSQIAMASDTTLGGTGTVQEVTMSSGTVLDLSDGGMNFNGNLIQNGNVITKLGVKNSGSGLHGNGVNILAVKGTLKLDFTGNTGAIAGSVFSVFDNWGTRTDAGLQIFPVGLPQFTELDTSNLFIDGTVTIVAGSRSNSQTVEITVPQGGFGSGSVILSNLTTGPLTFIAKDDGSWPSSKYQVITQHLVRASFKYDPGLTVTNWIDINNSAVMNIGFTFPLYGTEYTTFSINRYGAISFGGAISGSNPGVLPRGSNPVIAPFWGTTLIATNSIRYRHESDHLVVAWNNDNNDNNDSTAHTQEFQAWIYNDGSIRYLYQFGITGRSVIGMQNETFARTFDYIPGTTSDGSLLITPKSWVSSSPETASLNPGQSQTVTFTADATDRPIGEYFFTATIPWSDGQTSEIGVFITVTTDTSELDLLPSPLTFSGPAGYITQTNLVVSNRGSAPLSYTITDSGLQGAGYSSTNVAYEWTDLSTYTLTSTQIGSQILNLGFPFIYFGNTYTSLIANANGTLTLGSGQTISPFGASLSLDANASVRVYADSGHGQFTVTWKNVAQSGGSADLTFQTVLSRDGGIRFNYQYLGSGWTNGLIRLVDASGTVDGTLSNAQTTITYQSLVFTPGASRIISASPTSGTIPGGGSANIIITGDARSLTGGGANDVTNSTMLTFSYSGFSTNVDATFIATNSVGASYDELAPAIAGTDHFTADVVQNPDGTRLISWPTVTDGTEHLSRYYVVYFSTDLKNGWTEIYSGYNVYSYLDKDHIDIFPIYYKVTVE